MKFKIMVMLLIAVSLGLITWLFIEIKRTPRVAFVKTQVVLERYGGMQDAKVIYQNKVDRWQAAYDSLELGYNKFLQDYNSMSAGLQGKQKQQLEDNMKNQGTVLQKYSKSIEEKAASENEKLTQGVLNQVNSYIKSYAEKHGYDIVLGLTLSGNILYGSDATDITEEIIKGLNEEYKGHK
jgi:outer membrane protein